MNSTIVDVAVVGAGLSGLVAARRLHSAGLTLAILEARPLIGGRVEMARVADIDISKGGAWASREQPDILRLAEELGVSVFRSSLDPNARVLLQDESAMGGAQSKTVIRSLEHELTGLIATVPADRPWDSPDAASLDAICVADWFRARTDDVGALDHFDYHCTLSNAWDWADTSFLFQLAAWSAAGGIAQVDRTMELRFSRAPGGMAQMIAAALGNRVRCGWPVERIDTSSNIAVIEASRGIVCARRVVVAMSPSDAGRIVFHPLLPTARQDVQRHYRPGLIIKTTIVYDRPFWLNAGLSGDVRSDSGCPIVLADDTPQDRSCGRLVAFSYPFAKRSRFAIPAAYRDDQARRQDGIVANLVSWFGPRAAVPLAIIDTDWTREKYVAGVLGSAPVGLLTRAGKALRQPVDVIHWAGSESATRWPGYLSGAVEAGERAAAEVCAALT